MWHVKDPSLLNVDECRASVKIYSPSLVMVRSPYELKNLKWDEKSQTNKETNKHTVKVLALSVHEDNTPVFGS